MRLRRNRNQDHEAGRPSDDVANQSSPEASLGEGVDLAASVVGEPEPERPVLFDAPVDDEAPEADSSDPLFDEVARIPPDDGVFRPDPHDVVLEALGLPPDYPIEQLKPLVIHVLGPVEVEDWLVPPERAIVTELACYLALHRERPLSGEQLALALRPDEAREPSAKTMRTCTSLLRKAVGTMYLPSRGSGGYQFTFMVGTGWEIFKDWSTKDQEFSTRLAALDLIRGRPFQGVPAGTYGWVFSELWISQIESAIVALATEMGHECLYQCLVPKAEKAVRQGLLAVPYDRGLWKLRLEIAARQGATAFIPPEKRLRPSSNWMKILALSGSWTCEANDCSMAERKRAACEHPVVIQRRWTQSASPSDRVVAMTSDSS